MKAPHFHTKLHCQKPMLRQTELGVQSGPTKKNGLFSLTTLFLENLVWVIKPLINNWFNEPITA